MTLDLKHLIFVVSLAIQIVISGRRSEAASRGRRHRRKQVDSRDDGTGKDEPIVIVGGGLGGLTAALALGRSGRRVHVLEQAPQFGAIGGYGIQLGPNVVPMLDRLGVMEAVLAKGDVPDACIMLDAYSGDEIARIPLGPSFRARFKHPSLIIHRIDLHQALLEACRLFPAIALESGAPVEGFEDRGDHVVVHIAGGRRVVGAALIGADGLHSAVRAQLRSEGEPHHFGYVAQRTVVPMKDVAPSVPARNVHLWAGPGFHIVHYPLRHDTLFNVVAVYRTASFAERRSERANRAEVDRIYAGTHSAMRAILAMMDLERRWPLADRDPIRQWHRGRVTMVGDAAHPTLQSLAQGACMAVEDGVCLAALIDAADGDFAQAFARYEQHRSLRTARLQLESRYMWGVYHAEGIARDVMRETFAGRTEEDMFRCLAWLYDGFPVPERSRVDAARDL
jgi:3-hydroxybenzoate 6-monooxygenase